MKYSLATQAYSQVDLSSAVNSASPHKLISLLFGGALKQLAIAKGAMDRNDTALKGESISKAIEILGELEGSLRDRENNEISGNLSRLYDYMIRSALEANAKNSIEKLDEISGLISDIKETWDQIADQVASPQTSV